MKTHGLLIQSIATTYLYVWGLSILHQPREDAEVATLGPGIITSSFGTSEKNIGEKYSVNKDTPNGNRLYSIES